MEEAGKIQGKVGKGHPPKEYQYKPGESGNLRGRGKEVPNRSTVAKYVLEMIVEPPESTLRNLNAMYPAFFEKKGKKWTNSFIMNLRLAQKALVGGDVAAYTALMDSAYGRARQSMELSGKEGGTIKHEFIFGEPEK